MRRPPLLSLDDEDFIMKRHSLPPGARAVAAFLGTVVLALLAAVTVLMPDVAVQSVDSMLHLPPIQSRMQPEIIRIIWIEYV